MRTKSDVCYPKKHLSLLAALMAAVMLATVLPARPVSAGYQDDIARLEEEKKELQAQIGVLKREKAALEAQYEVKAQEASAQNKKLSALVAQMQALEDEIYQLEADITEQEGYIEGLLLEIDLLNHQIEVAQAELEEAQREEAHYAALLNSRIKAMYETNDANYLDMLFRADSISDFFCRMEYMRAVYDYDKIILANLKSAREKIESFKRDLEESRARLEEAEKQAEEAKARLEEQRTQKEQKMAVYVSQKAEMDRQLEKLNAGVKSLLNDIEAKDKAIEDLQKKIDEKDKQKAEIKRQADERAKAAHNAGSVQALSGLSFWWPLWNYPKVNDGGGWGYWYHPVTGEYKKHYGCDIGAPNGTIIRAAEDGVVTTAKTSGWNSGYGNLIVISHTSSVQTWYGHCSKVVVQEEQRVQRGDIIGYVGSTGNSTGNHLHFELIINGRDVNPELYVPKIWSEE